MHGFGSASYGDGFADVYDQWYDDLDDIPTVVELLGELADGGRVLELGVGTGRLAIPLAAHCAVVGIDSSTAMLDRLAGKDGGERVERVHGDMVTGLPAGPFALAFVANNTLFNLTDRDDQQRCFSEVAGRLLPGGHFVVDTFVATDDPPRQAVTVRSLTATSVVLSISVADAAGQRADGQFVDISEAGGVRLRPWSIRWSTVAELDAMATAAGFTLAHRWAGFDRSPFTEHSTRQVAAYRLPGGIR